MKKGIIALIVILAVLAFAAFGVIAYYSSCYDAADASSVPAAPIEAAGTEILPHWANLTVPVLKDLEGRFPEVIDILEPVIEDRLYKGLDCMLGQDNTWQVIPEGAEFDMQDPAAWLGLVGEAPYSFEIKLPEGMIWSVRIDYREAAGDQAPVFTYEGPGRPVSEGPVETMIATKAGEYSLSVQGTLEKGGRSEPYGVFYYSAYFEVKNPDPVFTVGRTELAQGDIFSMKLENVPVGVVPGIETELGPAIFTEGVPENEYGDKASVADGLTSWYAMAPVSNSRALGDYPVKVDAGGLSYEIVVTVTAYEFDFQDMYIDTSVPSVAAALTNEAIVEFREKVTPLLPLISEERYWDGVFIMPVDLGEEGFISTQFGEIRITNGDPNTRRSHLGMDLAVSTGEPVHAGGAGKVLLAEFLLNTGNTVIIDHGGGLKGFYYHMNSVEVAAGDFVEKGELIGTVGSTGYSTGPHLHYEMRIGDQPVSPSMLFDPGAGLYSANVSAKGNIG